MLVVEVGEDSTVSRGLRRSCCGDQATQNIFLDGALAMTLGERISEGLCHGAGHRCAIDLGEFGCQSVGFRVLDIQHHTDSGQRIISVYLLSTGVGGRGSFPIFFWGE